MPIAGSGTRSALLNRVQSPLTTILGVELRLPDWYRNRLEGRSEEWMPPARPPDDIPRIDYDQVSEAEVRQPCHQSGTRPNPEFGHNEHSLLRDSRDRENLASSVAHLTVAAHGKSGHSKSSTRNTATSSLRWAKTMTDTRCLPQLSLHWNFTALIRRMFAGDGQVEVLSALPHISAG